MFIIYGKNPCIFCDRAKALLTMRGHDFSYRDINVGSHYEDMKKHFPEAKTVPQIVHETYDNTWGLPDQTLIGGYKELQEYLS